MLTSQEIVDKRQAVEAADIKILSQSTEQPITTKMINKDPRHQQPSDEANDFYGANQVSQNPISLTGRKQRQTLEPSQG